MINSKHFLATWVAVLMSYQLEYIEYYCNKTIQNLLSGSLQYLMQK